jgi:hypothetical protein
MSELGPSVPDDLDREFVATFDGLAGWVARAARRRRWTAQLWVVVAAGSAVLALLDDDLLFLPLLPVFAAAVWLVASRLADRWWRFCSNHTGYPVVSADAPWTLSTGRRLPPGWPERGVPGALHRTPSGWVWRPSRLFAAELPDLRWPGPDVAVVTAVPIDSPLPPALAQLRFHLRGGGTVELLVRQPARLGPLTGRGGPIAD